MAIAHSWAARLVAGRSHLPIDSIDRGRKIRTHEPARVNVIEAGA